MTKITSKPFEMPYYEKLSPELTILYQDSAVYETKRMIIMSEIRTGTEELLLSNSHVRNQADKLSKIQVRTNADHYFYRPSFQHL